MSLPVKKFKPSYEIDDLSLHSNIIHRLKLANLCTFQKILHLSSVELQKVAKISASEAKATLDAVSHILVENEYSIAFDLTKRNSPQKLMILDVAKENTRGFMGLYTGTITEICGESGCGKTQLCLHLSIVAQLPTCLGGLNTKVVYIHSEGEFPIRRFVQLTSTFKKEHPEIQALNLSNNLILKKVHNLNAMMHVLQNGIPDLVKKVNPQVLVIDSVAALLRSEFDSFTARTSIIQNFGFQLWKLANVLGMAVICVNQVSGHTQQNESISLPNIIDVPSLGLLWSNILTTRLKISRKASQLGTSRTLEYIFSSYHPRTTIDFNISESGINFI